MTIKPKSKDYFDYPTIQGVRDVSSDKYIVDPIKSSIGLPYIKILYASTGFGKNYASWMKVCPWWFKSGGGQLFIMVSPFLETLSKREIQDYIDESLTKEHIYARTYFNGDDYSLYDVQHDLSNGKNVIMTFTDSSLINKMKDKTFIEILTKYGKKSMTIRDEISYGMTSCQANTQNNTGWSYQFYKAAYFKNFVKLLEMGSEVFGLTATPTREQLEELKSKNADYRIINTMPSKAELVMNQKWWNSVTTTDYTPDDYSDINILKNEIKLGLDTLSVKERKLSNLFDECNYLDTNNKLTMMVSLQTAAGNKPKFTISRFEEMLRQFPSEFGDRYKGKTYIVTTSDIGWVEYDFYGNETGQGDKRGDAWLDVMNDSNSSVRLLIVLQKGQYGINIPSLSYGISFKDSNSKTKDTDDTVRTSSKQFIGRFIRTNLGQSEYDLFKKLSDDFGTERGREYLQLKNTFDFRAVDGPRNFWRDSLEEYKEYGNSWDDFVGYFYESK
tara:strand:- start:1185 stop:2684 length:1500 start_codon:yes stop_codon:yes gene_type:complete